MTTTVHVLIGGQTACSMSWPPGDWPSGHEWIPEFSWATNKWTAEHVKCTECNDWMAHNTKTQQAIMADLSGTLKRRGIQISRIGPSAVAEMSRFPGPRGSPHIVDRDGCNLKGRNHDPAATELAHDIYDAFAWVEWASVRRTGDHFVVKVKHSYPIDVRPDLRAWLRGHKNARRSARFELQVHALDELEPPEPSVEGLFAKLKNKSDQSMV